MTVFFYELFAAFRGIDWFLIILLSMLLLLSFTVGITENSPYDAIEGDTPLQGFDVHVPISAYASAFMYAFTVFENEKILSVLGNTYVFVPYIAGIIFPFLFIVLHVILLVGGMIIRISLNSLYGWYQWKKMDPNHHR